MPNKKQLAFIEVKFNKEVFNMLWQYVNNQLGSKNHKYFHYKNATKLQARNFLDALDGRSWHECRVLVVDIPFVLSAAAKNFPICALQIFVDIFVQFVFLFKVLLGYKC